MRLLLLPALSRAVAICWLGVLAPVFAQTVATTTYGYDELGDKTFQVDAKGRTTTWALNALRQVTARTLQDGSQETSRYDSAGNLLARKTFAGETISYQYDAADRLTGTVVPAGAGTNAAIPGATSAHAYTASGLLQSRREQGPTTLDGLQTFKYDAMDRLVELGNPIGRIAYAVDAVGNVAERSVAGHGTIRYEYDGAGRLRAVIAPDGKKATYHYDAGGRVDLIERELNPKDGVPQVLATSFGYDAADRIRVISEVKRTGAAATFIVGQVIYRESNGAIAKIVTDRGTGVSSTTGTMSARIDVVQWFEYDGLARLTREVRETSAGTIDTRYEYDLVGNRTKKSAKRLVGTDITTYAYDAADRLVLESTSFANGGTQDIAYTWDGNGNLASKTEPGKVTLYRFDPRNRLIDVRVGPTRAQAEAAAPMAAYAYDDDGNRVRKSGAQASQYLVDPTYLFAHVALEKAGNSSVVYVRGASLLRQVSDGLQGRHELLPLHGHLGTSLGAVDANGVPQEQLDFDAFGVLDQPSGFQQTHSYTGEYWDQDAQLLYLRARWY